MKCLPIEQTFYEKLIATTRLLFRIFDYIINRKSYILKTCIYHYRDLFLESE